MTLSYKEYQETAIDELVKSISDLMTNSAKNKVCVFKVVAIFGRVFFQGMFIISQMVRFT